MSYDDPRFSRLDPWQALHTHLARLLLRNPNAPARKGANIANHMDVEAMRQRRIRAERKARA